MSENYSQEEHHKTYEDFYYEHLKQITNLKKQIEILEKSNEFYADESNYMMCRDIDEAILHDQQPLRDTIDMDDCDPNGGKLARQTKQQLKELREGSEE